MLRRFVPESPRWLVTHCRGEEAEETVKRIEADVVKSTGRNLPPAHGSLKVHPRKVFGLGLILTAMLGRYRQRSILALTLMVAQSFLYNSVFFTFGLIIANFYHVPSEQVGLYLFPLAIGNFCGPLLLGSLFDPSAAKDDCRHLCDEWRSFACDSLHVRRRLAVGDHRDDRLSPSLFFSVAARRFRLPSQQTEDVPLETPALGQYLFCALSTPRHRRDHFYPFFSGRSSIWFALARGFRYAIAALLLSSRQGRNLNSVSMPKKITRERIADPLSA